MNLLITGLTGFIGTNLFQYLGLQDQGDYIYTLTRNTSKTKELFGDTTRFIDDLSAQELDDHNIKVIIHLAGIAHDLSGQYREEDYDKVNYRLTKELYDAFLNSSKARKFVFVSSVKAQADEVTGVLTEDDKPTPLTPYGKSKLKAEKYIFENKKEGKYYYILRPAMVYGPNNKGNLNLLYKVIKKGLPYPFGAFENKRSFLSVKNLCFIIDTLIRKDIPAGDYNCADGNDLSSKELVTVIGKALTKKVRIWHINPRFILLAAAIGSRLKLPFDQRVLQKLTENYRVSPRKILSALSLEKMPFDTEIDLIETIKSFEHS